MTEKGHYKYTTSIVQDLQNANIDFMVREKLPRRWASRKCRRWNGEARTLKRRHGCMSCCTKIRGFNAAALGGSC